MSHLPDSESSPRLLISRNGLISAVGARAGAIFIVVLGASVSMTLITDYIEGDLGYQQPYFIVYFAHSCLSLLIPLHLAYLSWKTNVPVSRYIAELKHTLAQQYPKSGSPGVNYNSLGQIMFALAIGYNTTAVLWYACVVFAPISDVTALWSTNAFWTYILSVLVSTYRIGSSRRQEHKWEFRKLLAVSLASVGVAAIVYGKSSGTEQSTGPSGSSGGTTSSESPGLVLLGDALALGSALSTAALAVCYDRFVALPEDEGSRPPSPLSSDGIDAAPAEYHRLRTDDELTQRAGEPSSTSTPSHYLPFGLHANFFNWTIGIITLFIFWIPLCLVNVMKLGPPVVLPPNPKVWLYVGFVSMMSLTYNTGFLILLYLWGPVLIAVANLLTIVLVLAGDVLFGKGLQTITAGTLLGSSIIVGAFGLLARDAMMNAKGGPNHI